MRCKPGEFDVIAFWGARRDIDMDQNGGSAMAGSLSRRWS